MSRIFIAVALPHALKTELAATNEHWRSLLPFRKWVHRDDLHVTLKFLGETAEPAIPPISRELSRIAEDTAAFTLTIEQPGTFGRPRSPSVFWRGVGGDMQALAALQDKVENAMEGLGIAKEARPFHPHLTMARTYKGQHPFQPETLASLSSVTKELVWKVDAVLLYESRLGETPMYQTLQSFPLS